MNVLAIDASAKRTSAALLSGEKVLGFRRTDAQQVSDSPRDRKGERAVKLAGAAALLTPLIKATIADGQLSASNIQLFALPIGPGLFTGLRASVVTAKAFAYATDANVLGVNTLEVLAAKAHAAYPNHTGPIRVAINAQRKQLFTGRYRAVSDWRVEPMDENEILDQATWVDCFEPGDLVSGSGLKLVESQSAMVVEAEPSIVVAGESFWDCDAVSVGRVAIEHFRLGRRDDLWTLEPLYFRPSAAEEVQFARMKMND